VLGLIVGTAPDGFAEITGKPTTAKVPGKARDTAGAAKLWEVSEKLTGVRLVGK
jgi:hypothetical protein